MDGLVSHLCTEGDRGDVVLITEYFHHRLNFNKGTQSKPSAHFCSVVIRPTYVTLEVESRYGFLFKICQGDVS